MEIKQPIDERYSYVKQLIESGQIDTIEGIFKIIPKKQVAIDLGLNVVSFTNFKSKSTEAFKLGEIVNFAKLFNVTVFDIVRVFLNTVPNITPALSGLERYKALPKLESIESVEK